MAAEARDEAAARAAAADDEPLEVVFRMMRFEVGPNGKVLAAPPRNPEEAEAWGRPGPGSHSAPAPGGVAWERLPG